MGGLRSELSADAARMVGEFGGCETRGPGLWSVVMIVMSWPTTETLRVDEHYQVDKVGGHDGAEDSGDDAGGQRWGGFLVQFLSRAVIGYYWRDLPC